MIILQLLLLVIVVEAATEILVDAKITDGVRQWIFRKAFPEPDGSKIPWYRHCFVFLNNLITCGYCTSVWVAFLPACVAPSWFDMVVIDWFVNVLVLHRLSNWLHVWFMLVKKGRVQTYDIEVTNKTEAIDNGSS